uniref:Uncharacterized protein n=1 Tax=viral metagenome TaxID=1070528 RepID=A0A6C0DA86_9ZZZZ
MNMEVYELSLADRDSYLTQIENQIQSKRNLLIDKRKTLEQTVDKNQFLEGVKNDYQRYHNYIIKQNQDQIRAMNILNQYLDDVIVSGKLTEKDIHNTRHEQSQILGEMDKIKGDLDNIINSNQNSRQNQNPNSM